MEPSIAPVEMEISHPTYIIWGSNTSVGKTLVSTGLAFSVLSSTLSSTFLYLKPLQTGYPQDSDAAFLYCKLSEIFQTTHLEQCLSVSNQVLHVSGSVVGDDDEGGMRNVNLFQESSIGFVGEEAGNSNSHLVCKTLYCWKQAISPHLAAQRENAWVEDEQVVESLRSCFGQRLGKDMCGRKEDVWRVVETAGGVASPGPSGTLQCDLYRPFRLPSILVGDGRLGGISGTISAYETLKLRGYDVVAIILEDHGLLNEISLLSYLRNRVRVFVMPLVPQHPSNGLMKWFNDSKKVFNSLRDVMLTAHLERIQKLRDMSTKAGDILWWPFTQHGLVPNDSVTVIDSRCGENFAVYKACEDREMIVPQFDACASWWTQGPDTTLQIELARDMGYATARYGHVMFPENVYEPVLHCADLLLEGVGKGWASRVFFSDNGSTAVEIALKMAFRKFSCDHNIFPNAINECLGKKSVEFKVIALSGSYHGDTLGAMEAQAPSIYTGFLQHPWYSGRGLFLDPPTVFLRHAKWIISMPKIMELYKWDFEVPSFDHHKELFHSSRDSSDLFQCYTTYITKQLSQFSEEFEATHIGAVIIEPVIHAAGGMHMIDPLFQRILVNVCRKGKIPVIFDEVFTGFWRLGRESASELLGCLPDIACYAKLLTGGIIPLAATLATKAIFDAYNGNSKIKALLHGHSYSAHALGCTAACKAISWFKNPSLNLNISATGVELKEIWDNDLLLQISSHSSVKRVVALGTLCAIELMANATNVGYASLYASSLVQKFREEGIYMRPLGNVVYLMCGPCTPSRICNELLSKVYTGIKEFVQYQSAKYLQT